MLSAQWNMLQKNQTLCFIRTSVKSATNDTYIYSRNLIYSVAKVLFTYLKDADSETHKAKAEEEEQNTYMLGEEISYHSLIFNLNQKKLRGP
jgi:hypothetical protein